MLSTKCLTPIIFNGVYNKYVELNHYQIKTYYSCNKNVKFLNSYLQLNYSLKYTHYFIFRLKLVTSI